ncbi:L,D-transpeptidase [Alkalihalobacterium chitinilyticum]|uniref:L,D-transpeptidase n=1 Tax=Alkalihalobacterium chitinilyticum TaxID=2980103 RepID=A0ABT5VGY3_9BACI|nr:L,D-transpeptidase [Alkalihalobacterium chitinilyticum]MDE5414587.1 L,D-transpeptidase [Alkalihalobacterium chitinilyticum]
MEGKRRKYLLVAKRYEAAAYILYRKAMKDRNNSFQYMNEYKEISEQALFFYKEAHKNGDKKATRYYDRLKKDIQHRSSTLKKPKVSFVLHVTRVFIFMVIFLVTFFFTFLNPTNYLNYFSLFIPGNAMVLHENKAKVDEQTPGYMEPLLVLKSALYFYTLEHQAAPQSLHELTQKFPNNYLSFIPADGITGSNEIYHSFNGLGGWIYQPSPVQTYSPNEVSQLVSKWVQPNIHNRCQPPSEDTCDFQPLEIIVDKEEKALFLISGTKILRHYQIAVGKDNSTPTGQFYIQKRVINPNYHFPSTTKPFGTRDLELSNSRFAIHGTYEEESIGKNASKGCVRLRNEDVEELFSMATLGTSVTITDDSGLIASRSLINSRKASSFSSEESLKRTDVEKEEDMSTMYQWSH